MADKLLLTEIMRQLGQYEATLFALKRDKNWKIEQKEEITKKSAEQIIAEALKHRLDKPDRENLRRPLIDFLWKKLDNKTGAYCEELADQILALIPDIEEAKKRERNLLLSEKLLEAGRLAIKDTLIEWRDNHQ